MSVCDSVKHQFLPLCSYTSLGLYVHLHFTFIHAFSLHVFLHFFILSLFVYGFLSHSIFISLFCISLIASLTVYPPTWLTKLFPSVCLCLSAYVSSFWLWISFFRVTLVYSSRRNCNDLVSKLWALTRGCACWSSCTSTPWTSRCRKSRVLH